MSDTKKSNANLGIINYIAILAIFLFAGAGSWENAAIDLMAKAWPAVDITWIRWESTLPSLISMPVMLLAGGMVGKKISYRSCVNLGSLMIVLGGALPFFFAPSWAMVLVFRAVLGAGVGFYSVRNAALVKSIPLEKQARYIGLGTAMMNIGNVLMQQLAGILADKGGWNWAFLCNACVLISGIFIFFCFREPAEEGVALPTEDNAEKTVSDENAKLDGRAVLYAVMQFTATLVLYPLLSGMATFMAARNLGTASLVGTVLSSYTVAGFVVSFLLPNVRRIFKRKAAPVMYGLCALGMVLVLTAQNIAFVFIGTILCGIGFFANWSLFYIFIGEVVHPAKVGFASSLVLVLNQAAMFLSTYFITACHAIFQRGTDAESAYVGGVIFYVILTVILCIGKVVPIEEKAAIEEELKK